MSVVVIPFVLVNTFFVTDGPATHTDLSPKAAAFSEFFEHGFNRRQFSKDEMANAYRKLSREFQEGPEAQYAYALVLLHRTDFHEAMDLLGELRELKEPAFAPAWQLSIWQLFLRREYNTAFRLLDDFIDLTSREKQNWLMTGQSDQNAQWIGALMQSLKYQITSGKHARNLHTSIESATQSFQGALSKAFKRGVEQTELRYQKMSDELDQLNSQAKEQQEDADLKAAEVASEESAKAEDTREKLQLTAQEWKSKVENGLSDLDPKIQMAQKQFQTLNIQRQSSEKLMAALMKEQARLGFLAANPKLLEQSNIRRIDVLKERNRLAQKYQQLQMQRQKILASLNEITQSGLKLLNERQKLIQDYQKATGKLIQQDRELEKLMKELADSQTTAPEDKPVKSTAEIRRLKLQMKRFHTYLTISLENERESLVKSLNR